MVLVTLSYEYSGVLYPNDNNQAMFSLICLQHFLKADLSFRFMWFYL